MVCVPAHIKQDPVIGLCYQVGASFNPQAPSTVISGCIMQCFPQNLVGQYGARTRDIRVISTTL